MLKKIPVAQLELGMHIHSFEGSWVNHPFWHAAFVLVNPIDLDRARCSEATYCWIDESLGVVAKEPASNEHAARGIAAAPVELQAEPHAEFPTKTALTDELQRAAALCRAGSAEVARMFGDVRMGRALDAERCLPLVSDISESLLRNGNALVSLVRLKTQDDYTYMHCVAVCALMIALGRQLGLDETTCREAGMAGLLHDIGKAVMPTDILNKPGKLTDAEFSAIQQHPERGHELLLKVQGLPPSSLDVCLHHHEKFDGSGYPHRLAGNDIELFARMGALCDVYDAVTSDRPYKAGWNPGDAIAKMAHWQGHFDPELLKAFICSVGIYPIGSVVRLQSQRVAVVIAQSGATLTKPVVKVFFSLRSRMPVPPTVHDLSVENCRDRIVALEDIESWNQREIAAIWANDAMPKSYRPARRPVRKTKSAA